MGFLLTGASHYDDQAVVELLDSFAHHLKRLLGDGLTMMRPCRASWSIPLAGGARPCQGEPTARPLHAGAKASQSAAADLRNGECAVARAIARLQTRCEKYRAC